MRRFLFVLLIFICTFYFISCENDYKEVISKSVETTTENPVKTPKSNYDTPVAVFFQASFYNDFVKESGYCNETGEVFPEEFEKTVDIVYYAFAVVENGKANLKITSGLSELIKLKEKGVKIVLSIEGIAKEGCLEFAEITSSDEKCKVFVDSVLSICNQYGFDGADIDWEAITSELHPTADGMNRLMSMLREEADDGFYLSVDVPASKWGASSDRFDFKTLNNVIDYVNLMSYDLHTPEYASHISAVYTSETDNGYGFGAVYGMERLCELGLDKGKIMLGCASYGKGYITEEPISSGVVLGKKATISKLEMSRSYDTGTVLGKGLSEILSSEVWKDGEEFTKDGKFVGSYLYSEEGDYFVAYDSNKAFCEKYKLAKSSKGTGVMLWSYTTDPDMRFYYTVCEQKNSRFQ